MFPPPVDCPKGLAARGRIFGRRESGRHLVHGQDMHDQWFDYERLVRRGGDGFIHFVTVRGTATSPAGKPEC